MEARLTPALLVAGYCLWAPVLGFGQESENKQNSTAKTAESKGKKFLVKKETFKIEVLTEATFVARRMFPISILPREWTELSVLEVVAVGTRVKKGDRLILLDTTKLDRQIQDLEEEAGLTAMSLSGAREELKHLEKSTPLDLTIAERAHRIQKEDLEIFKSTGQKWMERFAELDLKWKKELLSYEMEELKQLEAMYKEDDLTEETEEIILTRQRNYVDKLKVYVEQGQDIRDVALKILVKRQEEKHQDQERKTALEFEKAQMGFPVVLQKKKLEVDKLAYQQKKAQETLAFLKADRAAMNVESPADGVVYYGPCEDGKWSFAEKVKPLLKAGGKLVPGLVCMTVLEPGIETAIGSVVEKDLVHLSKGLTGAGTAVAFPGMNLKAKVAEINYVVDHSGKFKVRFDIEFEKPVETLMPGMACTVRFVPYRKKDVIAVPSALIHNDEDHDDKYYVWVEKDGGKAEKRFVTRGREGKDRSEILEGLNEGDRLVAQPKEEQEAGEKTE